MDALLQRAPSPPAALWYEPAVGERRESEARASGDEEKQGRRSLADIVVRLGAIATALGAIIGVATLLWPDSPVRLVASLDRLEVDAGVALSEFSARQRVADAGADPTLVAARNAGEGPVLAATHRSPPAIALAQAPDGGAAPSQGPDDQAPDGGDAPSQGSEDQPQSEDSQPPPAESQGEPSPSEPGRSESSTQSDGASSQRRSEGEILTKVKEKLPPEKLPDACSYEGSDVVCGGSDEAFMRRLLPPSDIEEGAGGDGAVANAKALLAVLENTRSRPVSSGGTEPMGVTLSFDLELEGFSGKKAEVRWSLYDAGARKRVPRDWLVNRRALALRPEAAFDRESSEFWVPLPKRRGPFFVRLTVYDDEGERLTFSDSKSFR